MAWISFFELGRMPEAATIQERERSIDRSRSLKITIVGAATRKLVHPGYGGLKNGMGFDDKPGCFSGRYVTPVTLLINFGVTVLCPLL
jgi:hypothetical protein